MHEEHGVANLAHEIASGQGIGLAEAARLLPRDKSGRHTSPSTLTRWARTGTTSAGGTTVKLEVLKMGKRILTTRQAVERFLAALAAVDDTPPIAAPVTGRAAEKAREDEQRRLRELGL